MTSHVNEVEKFTSDPNQMRLFQQERAVLHVSDMIHKLMQEKSVTKTQIASKMGTSKAHITQLLSGRANMTLRTISDVLWSMDESLHLASMPLTSNCDADTAMEYVICSAAPTWQHSEQKFHVHLPLVQQRTGHSEHNKEAKERWSFKDAENGPEINTLFENIISDPNHFRQVA